MKRFATILFAVACLAACKSGYRAVEKFSPDQPEQLPTAYKTLRGVTVYADPAPTSLELGLIDEGISQTMAKAFTSNGRFNPLDAPTRWNKYRRHDEYAVLLMNVTYPAETAEVNGCPIIRVYASTTGYAAEAVAGFLRVNDEVRPVFPFMPLPRITSTRPECLEFYKNAVAHGAEHYVAANDTGVWDYLAAHDKHPFFE